MLKPTGSIEVEVLDNKYEKAVLKDIPLYEEEDTGEEIFLFSDLVRANQKRIAEKYNISIYNIFELALLHGDVRQRRNAIKEKFRFNKMLFYIWKGLEKEYGENVLIFDVMGAARAGPIPAHLGDDIKSLRERELIDIYLQKDGKKIPRSSFIWEELKDKHIGGTECILTEKGNVLAKKIWQELDEDIQNVIIQVKRDLMYIDQDILREKVHKEFPEYKINYIEHDKETFDPYLL